MRQLKTRTSDEAIGRWPGILSGLGVGQQFLVNKHGPCPMCQGKDRYRFDDKAGRGTWYCNHCGSGDGFDLLRQMFGWGFVEAAREIDRIIGNVQAGPVAKERDDADKCAALNAVWRAGKPVTKGDPVWLYLNRRTGLEMVPTDLRYHHSLRHTSGGGHPAMLAMMRYPDGKPASIHRTYLTADGYKANVDPVRKFMSGKPLPTASIRLSAPARHIGIAEGIETALCASRRFGVPVWAASNAGLLEAWIPPAGVESVLIAGDCDANYTGQSAAFSLAHRLVRGGYAVEIRIPEVLDKDWADEGI